MKSRLMLFALALITGAPTAPVFAQGRVVLPPSRVAPFSGTAGASASAAAGAARTAPALTAPALPSTQLPGSTFAAPVLQAPSELPAQPGVSAIVPESASLNAPAAEGSARAALEHGVESSLQQDPSGDPIAADQALRRLFHAETPPTFGPGQLYQPSYKDQEKLNLALQWASRGSRTAAALVDEFQRRGGRFVMDRNPSARYFAALTDNRFQPVIAVTHDLLWRRIQGVEKGAPWEFIAAMLAREMVQANSWYADIPASAEKLAAGAMNMLQVFVDVTNGNTRSWATDKDFRAVQHDDRSWVMWNWYEQLVHAARTAANGAQHLTETQFFQWVADHLAKDVSMDPSHQTTLWEQHSRQYYRPNDPRNGQRIPDQIPPIDRATFDRASYKVYGADGKGNDASGRRANDNVLGWISDWLRGRGDL